MNAQRVGATSTPAPSRPRPARLDKPERKEWVPEIPETAIRKGGEVSPAAFRLYCFYCARRNKETGGWRVKDEEAAAALSISRSRICEARNELRGEGWIAEPGEHFIKPLMGFEAVESPTEIVENSTSVVESPTEIVENSTGDIDKDRARGSTPHSLPTSLPNTHTASAPPASPVANVCALDALTVEDFESYARAQPWSTNPGGWARKAFRELRPDDVRDVRAFLARGADAPAVSADGASPGAAAQTRRPGLMSLALAKVHVRSVTQTGTTPAAAVAELFEAGQIDSHVRAELLAVDFGEPPPPAGARRRTHLHAVAPPHAAT